GELGEGFRPVATLTARSARAGSRRTPPRPARRRRAPPTPTRAVVTMSCHSPGAPPRAGRGPAAHFFRKMPCKPFPATLQTLQLAPGPVMGLAHLASKEAPRTPREGAPVATGTVARERRPGRPTGPS